MGNDITKEDIIRESIQNRRSIRHFAYKYNIPDDEIVKFGIELLQYYDEYPQ